jgi:sulfate permease, SulP family
MRLDSAWRTEVTAGAIASILSLPVCVAAGVLAFSPLGPAAAALGATAGLLGAIAAGGISGLVATSSFVLTIPRVSEALVLVNLIVTLLAKPDIASNRGLIVFAVYACVLLGGMWQAVFGLAGVAKIIKFTPHTVLVGFLGGVAVLVLVSQMRPYLAFHADISHPLTVNRPWMLVLLLFVTATMWFYLDIAKRLPGASALGKFPPVVVAFLGGIALYYLLKALVPSIDVGPTLGNLNLIFLSPIFDFGSGRTWHDVMTVAWDVVPISVILAIVATLDSLLTFRTAQNASDLALSPVRDLAAQGLGNCAAALAGGITGAAVPSSSLGAYRAGGRTRLVPVSSALLLLGFGLLFPNLLARIPSVVLAGILLAAGLALFDRSAFQIVSEIRNAPSELNRRRAAYDLAVILIVMGVTVFYSVVAGVVAGCLLAGTIFVINMSRPIVRRTLSGADIQSKRIRPSRDIAILNDTGGQRAVLQLEGVLFFGNADDLSARIKELFAKADMVALDMRGVTDIDVSGANVLANMIAKSRTQKKDLLFCGVPAAHIDVVRNIVRKAAKSDEPIRDDLDSSLEWMEEKSLFAHASSRHQSDILELGEIDFLAGIAPRDLEPLHEILTRREFAGGETICREGDDGDRMWLLAKGSVSVRIVLPDGRGDRRVASLARGTTIGEMALVESARRSATIVADEDVVCYELSRGGFDLLRSEYPVVATRLLSNLSRELARRLRRTTQDLRNLG